MMDHEQKDYQEVYRRLEMLREIPGRDPGAAERGRAEFLSLAEIIAQEDGGGQAIFNAAPVPGFIRKLRQMTGGLRLARPSPAWAALFVIFFFMLFSTGTAVFAAQNSLPTDALYPLKILSEDIRFDLAARPDKQLELALDYSARRVNEAAAMAYEQAFVPVGLQFRLQEQQNIALQLAAEMQDPAMLDALTRMTIAWRLQAHLLDQAHEQASGSDPVLAQMQEQVRVRLKWIEFGLRDPQEFRKAMKEAGSLPSSGAPGPAGEMETREHGTATPDCEGCLPPTPDNGAGAAGAGAGESGSEPGMETDAQPGGGTSSGDDSSTPEPGEQYGPGPKSTEEGSKSGDGGHGGDPTSEVEMTPMPGEGPAHGTQQPKSGGESGHMEPNRTPIATSGSGGYNSEGGKR